MKVLTIMGSPRKGYGTIIMKRLEQELQSLQKVDFEYLYLKDVNLELCRGCSLCFFKGEDKCPLKNDDRDEIVNKIKVADGVIFMAPAYSLHVPALMKNFFDRLSYIFHRPCFFGKIAIGVSNQGIMGSKTIIKYFKEVASSWGFNYVNSLVLSTGPYDGTYNPFIEKKMEKKIQETCKIFLKALNGRRYHKPSLGDVLGFRIRKLMNNVAPDDTNADYIYWYEQGWLDEDTKHYYDAKIGIGKRLFARLLNKILKPDFKKINSADPKIIHKKYLKLESLKF